MTKLSLTLLLLGLSLQASAQSRLAEPKPVLEVTPTIQELGSGWTTNIVAYLIDPRSTPSEIDYRVDPKTSMLLAYQRSIMETNNRTGCAMVMYGRSNLVMNSGLYRVFIQRWTNRRALHNSWVTWKMDPARVVRNVPPVGEDCFWTNDFWRQTPVGQNLVFRRGLFHIVVEAGINSDFRPMLRLAQVFDAKIRGRPAPPEEAAASSEKE